MNSYLRSSLITVFFLALAGFGVSVCFRSDENAAASRSEGSADFGRLPLAFEPNQGQVADEVRFLARGSGYAIFLTPRESVFRLRGADGKDSVLRMRLENANGSDEIEGEDPQSGKSNYFIGSEPKNWRTEIPHFSQVRHKQVYPGIDQIYYGNGRQLEYDFVIAPNADPSHIAIRFEGVDRIAIDARGDLLLSVAGGEIRQLRPVIYQENDGERQIVSGDYILSGGNTIAFDIGEYDRTRPLVIDPVLVYSTYLGGNGADSGKAIAIDPSRNVYVTGLTASTNFPTVNPLQPNIGGSGSSSDIFVTKINAAGNAIVYSTYVGGSVGDIGHGIDVDNAGNVYVAGVTGGTLEDNDFPTTPGAFDRIFNSPDEAVLLKINAAGNTLVYSTYTGAANALEVKVDKATGEAFIAGNAGSMLPTTPGAFRETCQPTPCSGQGFITKFNSTGSGLIYSTYIGPGIANDLAIDAAGNAYVTGSTISNFFPITPGAAQTTCTGCNFFRSDAFVMKMNPTGSGLVYSTYLGGSIDEVGTSIAVDQNQNAYVTGRTESSNAASVPFPTTPGAFQTISPGIPDGFVTKVNPAGSAFVYSTYLGGNVRDESFGIAVDPAGNAHVIGQTRSNNFPKVSAIQSTCTINGPCVSISSLNASGSAVIFSTYFGQGMGSEIAADNGGNIYVTGETYEGLSNLPLMNPIQPNPGGGNSVIDAFVAKIFVQSLKPAFADFDGDGKADIAVRRPSDNTWYLLRTTAGYTAMAFGIPGDLIAPADYDGDGKTDVAVFRPSENKWYIHGSTAGFYDVTWGTVGDIPVPADYDGDGKSDVAIYRPSSGTWYIVGSSAGLIVVNFGTAEDKPYPADYDGDGKADIVVRRPSENNWYLLRTTAGYTVVAWGINGDQSAPADYDGDGKTDLAVFRPSNNTWYIFGSTRGQYTQTWGMTGDVTVPADFDGDGKADVAVFRPSNGTWYIIGSTAGIIITTFGQNGDTAIPSVFNY